METSNTQSQMVRKIEIFHLSRRLSCKWYKIGPWLWWIRWRRRHVCRVSHTPIQGGGAGPHRPQKSLGPATCTHSVRNNNQMVHSDLLGVRKNFTQSTRNAVVRSVCGSFVFPCQHINLPAHCVLDAVELLTHWTSRYSAWRVEMLICSVAEHKQEG